MNSYYIKFPNESAILVSPLIQIIAPTQLCLDFWYHMYSDSTAVIGSLEVSLIETTENGNNLRTIWSRAGGQSKNQSEWSNAQINIDTSSTSFRIAFKAKRYLNFYGDIALDDISFSYGECSNPDTQQSKIYFYASEREKI